MRVRMVVDHRVLYSKGAIVDAEEREAARLLSLGFAVPVEEKPEKPVQAEENPEKPEKPVRKSRK